MLEIPATLTFFCELQTGLKVIKHNALPIYQSDELNDPFLLTACTELGFDCQELFEYAVKYLTSAILGKMPPRGNPNHPIQKAIMRWRGEDRFADEEEIRESLVGLLPTMVEQSFNHAKAIHEAWKIYAHNKRITRLYERSNDFNLWHDVGDKHKGMAIKFKCIEDSIFEQCCPVKYSKKPAKSVNIAECVNAMVGESQELGYDYQSLLLAQNYLFRKHKEWRLIVEQEACINNRIDFPVEAIQSIYIGADIPADKAERLIAISKQLSSKINVYQAKCQSECYELSFEKC